MLEMDPGITYKEFSLQRFERFYELAWMMAQIKPEHYQYSWLSRRAAGIAYQDCKSLGILDKAEVIRSRIRYQYSKNGV